MTDKCHLIQAEASFGCSVELGNEELDEKGKKERKAPINGTRRLTQHFSGRDRELISP